MRKNGQKYPLSRGACNVFYKKMPFFLSNRGIFFLKPLTGRKTYAIINISLFLYFWYER